MKSIARFACCLSLVLPVCHLRAQEQIAWVADVQTASAMAAEQRRLVLLHFFSDNCEPCVRLEQNVFSQPEVAQAVSQNYLAVKVHAGKNPQLAARYRVNRWPTDVFVTPSGLEIYRTISPQKPGDYVAVLNQVAQQTGIGAGRQWQSPLDQVVRPVAAEAALEAGKAVHAANTAANTAASNVAGQIHNSVAAGQQAAHDWNAQANNFVERGFAASNQWGQAARQAGDQFQQSAQQFNQTAQQTAQQTAEQFQQTARGLGQDLQQAATVTGFDRRSAFMSPDAPALPPQQPIAQQPVVSQQPPTGSVAAASPPASQPALAPPAASAAPPLVTTSPPLPANNPWLAQNPPAVPAAAAAAPPASAIPPSNPERQSPGTVQPQGTAAGANAAPSGLQMIPVSQAPAIGLDGFCPVTLIETMTREPASREAWKKGSKEFGAIHSGRTYLFTSAENQQRFLANPDAYAPALAGHDPVRFAERGELVDGKRAYGMISSDRRIYLFAEEASRNRFEQSPAAYSNAVQQAMRRSETGSVYR